MSRGRGRFTEPEAYDEHFKPEEFLRWLAEVVDELASEISQQHRRLIDDIVQGGSPRMRELDELTMQLCDLSKLYNDVRFLIARDGLNRTSNYLVRKLNG